MVSQKVATNIHHLPGRLRVRLPMTRRDEPRARLVKDELLGLTGVKDVRVSTLTGSVLIHYDTALANQKLIDSALRRHGFESGGLPARAGLAGTLPGASGARVASVLVETALEEVVKRCAVAVIAALV